MIVRTSVLIKALSAVNSRFPDCLVKLQDHRGNSSPIQVFDKRAEPCANVNPHSGDIHWNMNHERNRGVNKETSTRTQ
jgi:hypothetical protein